ncbi:kinase domain protein [Tribonema minus]|uniref:Kinase domain protein n=1 Tax=Tribonema minus TaxID=303371 RepID=A0A836CM58_9STRA|nr:kinase domain protein [Tribonema minus]
MLAVAPGRHCENHDPKQRSGATSGSRAAAEAATTAPACDLKKVEVIEHRRRTALGEELVTRYVKGRLLGKGGFAKVYLVTTEDTHQHYAMKVVPRSLLTKRRAKDKLRTEIKIHRSIAHPRVVRFHAYFEDADNVYILLELCTNGTLSELMRRRRRFDAAEARKYMLQMLEAVHYCHRHGIIHRDLKLGNLFLDGAWDIKMGDFGLAAKVTGDDARRKTICGTPNYIAPEILEGSGTGHSYQVDVWSMGVVLYTMLVGRPPFESRDVKSTYRRILQNVYAFPEGTAVSEDAKGLVRCMLQTAPDQRPTLEEILNHPFLRDGGAARSFNTTYTLRPEPSSGGAAAAAAAAAACASASRQLRSGAAATCGAAAAPAPAPR